MKTIFYAPPTRKEYLSPECDILNLNPEGIICESTGDMGIPDWTPGGDFPSIF